MKTKCIIIDGVELIVRDGYTPSHTKLNQFPACCGAGVGISQWAIPERMYFLRISAACEIHDNMFEHGAPTYAEFHQINGVMQKNLRAIIRAKSCWIMRYPRLIRAEEYFFAVDTAGIFVYKNLKKEQRRYWIS